MTQDELVDEVYNSYMEKMEKDPDAWLNMEKHLKDSIRDGVNKAFNMGYSDCEQLMRTCIEKLVTPQVTVSNTQV